MKTTYFDDDTLVILLSDKPITREVSQDWNTHICYAADGTIVEIVIIEAKAHGMLPAEMIRAA
jgi:uncharacterized protein YuzE